MRRISDILPPGEGVGDAAKADTVLNKPQVVLGFEDRKGPMGDYCVIDSEMEGLHVTWYTGAEAVVEQLHRASEIEDGFPFAAQLVAERSANGRTFLIFRDPASEPVRATGEAPVPRQTTTPAPQPTPPAERPNPGSVVERIRTVYEYKNRVNMPDHELTEFVKAASKDRVDSVRDMSDEEYAHLIQMLEAV